MLVSSFMNLLLIVTIFSLCRSFTLSFSLSRRRPSVIATHSSDASKIVRSVGEIFDEVEDSDSSDDEENLSDEELLAMAGDWDPSIPQFNRVVLTGRVGNDPEPRYFDDGQVVLNLSLACRRKYDQLERVALGIKSGEEETDWFGLEMWGRNAEFAAKYVTKGAR
jgi:hypothetical protein